MATAAPTAMSTDTDPAVMLTLAQWFSPAFPIGAFSYSHGLEALVDRGEIGTVAQFRDWMAHVLEHGAGRNDLIFLSAAYRADRSELAGIDALARAMAPSSERLLETVDQGGSFIRTINAVWSQDLPPLSYPLAVGAAARACDLPLEPTARMYIHGFLSALTSAAIRLVPLGQTEGQQAILALTPLCHQLCDTALDAPLDSLGSSTFLADIASMQHETQYSRMFRS